MFSVLQKQSYLMRIKVLTQLVLLFHTFAAFLNIQLNAESLKESQSAKSQFSSSFATNGVSIWQEKKNDMPLVTHIPPPYIPLLFLPSSLQYFLPLFSHFLQFLTSLVFLLHLPPSPFSPVPFSCLLSGSISLLLHLSFYITSQFSFFTSTHLFFFSVLLLCHSSRRPSLPQAVNLVTQVSQV